MLALLAALLLQESATELFKKVEEKYATAATFTMSAEARHAGKVADVTFNDLWHGHLRSKGTNRLDLQLGSGSSCKFPVPKTRYLSDGKSVAITIGQNPPQQKTTTLSLGTWSRRDLVRGGLVGSMASIYGPVFTQRAAKIESLFRDDVTIVLPNATVVPGDGGQK